MGPDRRRFFFVPDGIFISFILWLMVLNGHIFCELPSLPLCLQAVPYANRTHMVKSERVVTLKGVKCPYNSALVSSDDGYLLIFRQDCSTSRGLRNRIGIAKLDRNFNQVEQACHFFPSLEDQCFYDPRAFRMNGKIYILLHRDGNEESTVFLATVNQTSLKLESMVPLQPPLKRGERNWTLLVPSSDKTSSIHFIHTIYPTVEGVIDLSSGAVRYGSLSQNSQPQRAPLWKWGTLSGGTHAIEIDDMYICFFHSWTPVPKRCYVMGACAFSKESPHRILAISPYPIITEHMYETNFHGQIGPLDTWRFPSYWLDRVIFPCGAVLTKDDSGKEVFHVSCGENDMATRILTIDKEKLLESLCQVNSR